MALDALDILGDTLPKAKPVPESPKLRPEDIVDVFISLFMPGTLFSPVCSCKEGSTNVYVCVCLGG